MSDKKSINPKRGKRKREVEGWKVRKSVSSIYCKKGLINDAKEKEKKEKKRRAEKSVSNIVRKDS